MPCACQLMIILSKYWWISLCHGQACRAKIMWHSSSTHVACTTLVFLQNTATSGKSSNYPCILCDLAHNGEQLTSGQCCMKLSLEGHVHHCHFLCHYTKATAVDTLSLPHEEQMPWNHICLVLIKKYTPQKIVIFQCNLCSLLSFSRSAVHPTGRLKK